MTDLVQPSTPDPKTVVLVMGVLRVLLGAAGSAGIVVGHYDDQTLLIVAGALVTIGAGVWSWIKNQRAQRLDHEGSLASAAASAAASLAAGTPTPVAVQPVARAL